jgi:1-acyl-sn-glycerol-3-phosphate acyltransferase
MSVKDSVPYPRRQLARGLLRGTGRILMPLLTRTTVTDRGNLPGRGPLLVVGNHMATMEVVLMLINAPWQLEMLGAGDINPPPWMHVLTRLYGFIPVNRGNFDREAITQALGVLQQGGIMGIFPEGGVWDPGAMEAKRGVAWLSYYGRTPILPIGFGGVEGAMNQLFKLKRPQLAMDVGEVMPPVTLPAGTPRRQGLQQAANRIMEAIEALIPEAYRAQHPEIIEEHFVLQVTVQDAQSRNIPIPPDRTLVHADALCKLFYRPWILHVFITDLGFPAQALQQLNQDPSPEAFITALDPILRYVTQENPGFFPYRFGHKRGFAMQRALQELRALAGWAAENHYHLQLRPTRRYRVAGQHEEIVETEPGPEHVW